ncbi:transporter substrate-binding domain-containing protein [Sinanaerobacter chloroacetimidivorans]|jgi:ABC-type amino acid transport substrate-binding protein|uniref:Transporter substrate-binding domain-containing protein n=1 Tax=Sinanaerobacter chloroacetimidivorans TaxID=2818044 RepID=A0A8J7W208_9FIRM|nr:transporter substrate-binding domain-containing protein [Sinanaerobacter chloroacetimidivorans]MBR0597780.1 transporter substrate-binding domain-containing protein [Sinanaerobacter chloroacetimidivorans]
MKKYVSLGLVLLLLVSMLAGCGGGAKEDTDEGTPKAKVYNIATDTTFAPFEFQNDAGEYVGIDIEILAAIAEDQGFEYKLNPLGFSAAVAALESNQTDAVIAGMSITEERQKKYDFSEAYYDSGVVMAISATNDTITSYDDLKGKKVAVKTGTEGATFAESIKDQYGFQVVYFDESPFMYEDVKTGNSVACFEDYPVMGYGITQGNGLKMVTDMEKGSSYGFAVLKGKNTELLEMFDAGLKNIRDNGKYQEILDKYIAAE